MELATIDVVLYLVAVGGGLGGLELLIRWG